MDNLKNMQTFLPDNFNQIDKECRYELSMIINSFDNKLAGECKKLRNMIHYNEHEENFLDYVDNELKKDNCYINSHTYKIIHNYMAPLTAIISDYLQINDIKSMNDFEKVVRRLISSVTGKKFRRS